MATLVAYFIQDQFIPLYQLKLDNLLKDGEGAFGEVFHGTYLGMDIAAKRAKPTSSQQRKEIYKAFLNEAKILSELGHHSNIVKLIGLSPMLEDEFYIVMEYCDGGTALSYLQNLRGVQDVHSHFRAVVKICMGVCDAMHYFHAKGYTHRDINASNIMVRLSSFLFFSFLPLLSLSSQACDRISVNCFCLIEAFRLPITLPFFKLSKRFKHFRLSACT